MESHLKVIVVGSGNSGSGAIFDYLKGRPDFISPLSQEFRLIQDPGGIMDLHSALIHGFHVNRASAAIENFIDLCERCGREKTKFQDGLLYNRDLQDYYKKVVSYIEKITEVQYQGMPFCERSKLSKWKTYLYRKKQERAINKGKKYLFGNVRLPVTEEKFLRQTEIFLNSLFDIDSLKEENKKNIVIDQGGSYWQPASSNAYYGKNCKTIVVSRDPRGIYNSFITKGMAYPGRDVKLFCRWYKNMKLHVDSNEWKDDNVMHIQFEDFVRNFNKEKKKLDKFLGIPIELSSKSDISESSFNADKFRKRLTDEELSTIETDLKQYLYF